jgi:uncharacterized protein (TIGR02996 family)
MTAAAALASVETAIGQGDEVAALSHALAAWQHVRHPRITTVIETLSSRLARTRARPGGKSVEQKQQAWLALAAANEPADVELLLATLLDVRKAGLLEARLSALKGRTDPRIARAMHLVLEESPIPGAAGTPVLLAAMELVVAIVDPRSDDAWSRLVRIIGDRGGGPAIEGLRKKMPSGSTRLRAAFDEIVTELSDDDAARLDAIERQLAPRRAHDASTLFAAVYANPDDDQPRSVLADLLQELGDPRGELIALQLRPGKRSKREKELLDAHAHDWLGAIAPVVARTGLGYERGFVARCCLRDDGSKAADSFAGLPEWRTVTEVDLATWDRDPIPLIAGMPSLRVLRGVARPNLVPPHERIERIAINVISSPDELTALDGLPALRAIEIAGCWTDFDTFDAFWRSPTIARITELSIRTNPAWLAAMRALGIARIGYQTRFRRGWRLWFEGEVITVESMTGEGYNPELIEILGLVEEPQRLRVVFAGTVDLDLDLRAALSRFAGHELVE